jgi:rubrerythrin
MQTCPTCGTPLNREGACVTCSASADGWVLISRSDYASVREALTRLQEGGLGPEMERVPPGNEHEERQPRWNLYVHRDEFERAGQVLGKDWRDLLPDEVALEAAHRGAAAVDLDSGAEVTCPACGHVFTPEGEVAECPDCGLGLGAPA